MDGRESERTGLKQLIGHIVKFFTMVARRLVIAPMPRILILNKAPPYRNTGAEQVVWRVGTHLAHNGWDVHFLSPSDPDPPDIENVTLHGVPTPDSFFAEKAAFFLKGVGAYRRVTSELDPDIIYDNASPLPFVYAYVADSDRVVTKVHAIYGRTAVQNKDHPLTQVGTVMGEQCYRVMDGVRLLTVSESTRDRLKPLVRRSPEEVTVVRNGINVGEFDYSFEPDGPVVTLCELTPRKNVVCLLRAWRRLEDEGIDRELVIAGDGPRRDSLEALAEDFSLTDVTFRGYVSESEKTSLLCDAFCYVLPTRMEGFGLTNLEAMASGCVTVSTATPGVRDYLEDGQNGFVVPKDDPVALAETVRDVIDRGETLTEVVMNGRRTAEDNHAEDAVERERKVLKQKLASTVS